MLEVGCQDAQLRASEGGTLPLLWWLFLFCEWLRKCIFKKLHKFNIFYLRWESCDGLASTGRFAGSLQLLPLEAPASALALVPAGGLGDSPVEFKPLAGTAGDTLAAAGDFGDRHNCDENISSSAAGLVEAPGFVSLETGGAAVPNGSWLLLWSSNPSISTTEKLLN